MSTNDNPLMTISEVADTLRIHPRTLWRLRSAGGFVEPVKVGKQIRFRASDLAAWVEAQI